MLWTGRVLTGLGGAFMLFDSVLHLSQTQMVLDSFESLGYDHHVILPLSMIELIAVALYLYPRTALWGAIVLTGYLGGAVATHVIAGNGLFGYILFPVYVAILLWGGLALRKKELADLRELIRLLSLEKSKLRKLECLQAELRPYLVDESLRGHYILTYGAVLGSRIKGPKLKDSSEEEIETQAKIVKAHQAWLSSAERLTRELLMKNPVWLDVLSLEWGNYERNKFGSDEVERISSRVLRLARGLFGGLAD